VSKPEVKLTAKKAAMREAALKFRPRWARAHHFFFFFFQQEARDAVATKTT
jgi:hypothetical protein